MTTAAYRSKVNKLGAFADAIKELATELKSSSPYVNSVTSRKRVTKNKVQDQVLLNVLQGRKRHVTKFK